MEPDFESNADSSETNSHPYVYIEHNNFTNNMAYFAGNAIYMSHSVKRIKEYHDYLYMCGAGVHIDNNNFIGNNGPKKHNGGAIMHRCFKRLDSGNANKWWIRTDQTSSYMLASRNKTEDDPDDLEYFYDDPTVVNDQITDLYDNETVYTLLKYATKIVNNNFTQNYAGVQGSAIALHDLSEIQIANNTFKENGPTSSFSEALFSPYYKYFAEQKFIMTLNHGSCDYNYTNEFMFFEKCFSQMNYIDLPPLKGAVYIHHCNDDITCNEPVSMAYIADQQTHLGKDLLEIYNDVLTFQAKTQMPRPYQRAEISYNMFDNNQAFPLFSE